MTSFGCLRAPAAASRLPAANTRPAPLSPRAPHPPAQQQHGLLPACPTAALTEALTTTSKTNNRPAVIPKNSPSSASQAAAQRRSSGYDDSYDSAIPMTACPGWERVEEDLGLDEAPGAADPREWEEMVSLLSFDGEEHKHVTRQAHGANARVEDMFASFDGDDFEAVLRAVRSELPPQPNSKADAAAAAAAGQQQQQQQQAHHGAAAKAQPAQSLYESVCALREAVMAAEAARKLQAPAVKKRRAPLGQPNPADAWMLQVPTTVTQSDTTSAGFAAPAAAQGTTQQQQPSSQVAAPEQRQQQRYSLQGSSQQLTAASGAPLQLQQMAYIGLSCDSSSDASQDADMPAPAAAAAGAATVPRTTSNNIVSISRLGAAVAAARPTTRVLAGAAAAAGATTAVLEAAPVTTAAAPVQLLSRAAVLLTATDEVQAATGVQHNIEVVVGEEAAQADGQQQRWGSRNTQGLRRALARLHHTQQQQ